jgi:CubicO group peptidase (beta-lactamase class C family)
MWRDLVQPISGVRVAAALAACASVAVTAPHAQSTAGGTDAIERLVHETRVAHRLPGLAVVVVRSDGEPRVYVSGERRIGRGDSIAPGDRMHLGSLTKAVTATVIGALAEQRRISLETTIGQAFPELSATMQPAYRGVSVRQLLAHAGGVPQYGTRESLLPALALPGTAAEQRRAFVERVLAEPPRFEAGTRHEYSNAGGAIAGAIAERMGGSPYPQLVQELVFGPLGGRAAFGNPGVGGENQPWGHVQTLLRGFVEITPTDATYTTPLAIEPAGEASPSLRDYGRFLRLHLRGLRGRDDVLKAATIQDLHTKVPPVNWALGFVMGWVVTPQGGGPSHQHTGSYGAYTAFASIQPARDVAVAAFSNAGGQGLRDTLEKLALEIAARPR